MLAFVFIPIYNFYTLPERPPPISELVKSTETSLKFVLSFLLYLNSDFKGALVFHFSH